MIQIGAVLGLLALQACASVEKTIVAEPGLAPYPSTPGPIAPRRYIAELVIRSL